MLLDWFLRSPLAIGVIVSFFMILDIQLTRISYKLSKQGYSDHFTQQIFELNPRYQEIIHQGKKIPRRTYFARLAFGTIIGGLVYLIQGPFSPFSPSDELVLIGTELLVGAVCLLFLGINLGHVNNIVLFRYVKNHPGVVEGEVAFDTDYLYLMSRRNYLTTAIMWFVVYALVGRYFFLGGGIEFLALVLVSFYWQRKANKISQ